MSAALSIWEKESFYAPQDILIVGGGLMGLWSALELKNADPSLRITVLERSTTPLGASTRNAGFACFGSPTELLHDASVNGTDSMLSLVEMRYKGIEKIRRHFSDQQIGYEACGGYECINKNYNGWNGLDNSTAWLNNLLQQITGIKNIFTRSDEQIISLGLQHFDALIENKTEAALHSGKLVQSLLQKVQETGVSVLNGIQVTHWENGLVTARNIQEQERILKAERVLFCTNAFTQKLLPDIKVTPGRGQIIVTAPIPNLPLKGTFHFDEGFYYWRHLGNRILIGGARNKDFAAETTLDMEGSDTIHDALVDFLRNHLHPSIPVQVEHHWSGIMGFTEDKQPLLKETAPGVFAAIACNGMGVALTPVIAEQVAKMVLS